MNTEAIFGSHSQHAEYHWFWSAASASVVLITIAFRYLLPVRDGDLWFHMLYGKYFIANKTLIADHTIFSWTPATNDTIYCTWLPDLFLYITHQIVGLPGLFAFRYACLFFFVMASGLFAHKLRILRNPLVWLCVLIGVLMAYVAAYLKPEIFSFVLMTALVWNWWHIRTGGENAHRWCYAFPFIMLVWVNSHGAFIFGYVFLLTIVLGEALNSRWSNDMELPSGLRRHLWISMGLTLLVPFANPYGWRYPLQLFWSLMPTEANLDRFNQIAAFEPTFKNATPFHAFGFYADIAILVLAVLFFLNFKNRRIEWSSLLSIFVFTLLYTRFLRTTFFFAPVFSFASIAMIQSCTSPDSDRKLFIRRKIFPIAICLSVLWISLDSIYTGYTHPEDAVRPGHFGISSRNPIDSAEYIKSYFPHSKIGNTYSAGSYLLWKLWPGSKVSFDARHFPYRAWIDDFMRFCNGFDFSRFLNTHKADLWCIEHSDIRLYYNFINSGNWKLAFYGRSASVFVPENTHLPGSGKYEVATHIDNENNPYTLHRIFLFAVTIQDWATADTLLRQMKTLFPQPEKEPRVLALQSILAGMKAFTAKDYRAASALLGKARRALGGLEIVLAMSYMRLAQQDMDAYQYEQARRNIYAASEILPGALSAYYNIGIIEWVLYQREMGYHTDTIKKSYLNALQNFVDKRVSTQNYEAYAGTAQKILKGRLDDTTSQPKLIIPNADFSVR